MRRVVILSLITAGLMVFVLAAGLGAQRPIQVEAAAIREPQPVTVTNFPAVQGVSGAVNVGNFPAVQSVSGSVTVSNLPLDAQGNVRVADLARTIHLVGFTSAQMTGVVGALAMNRVCNDEFPGSRICTTEEVVETVDPPASGEAIGWVRSVPAVVFTGNSILNQDTVSGLVTPGASGEFSCQGFANPNSTGLTVNQSGQFQIQGCGTTASVACCGH